MVRENAAKMGCLEWMGYPEGWGWVGLRGGLQLQIPRRESQKI